MISNMQIISTKRMKGLLDKPPQKPAYSELVMRHHT